MSSVNAGSYPSPITATNPPNHDVVVASHDQISREWIEERNGAQASGKGFVGEL